jgi:dynein intermediate chain
MSTSTSDLESDDENTAGPSRRKIRDGGNGRETEDDMRKRILEELEVERKALEQELRELKEKAEDVKVERESSLDWIRCSTDGIELSEDQRQAIYAAPDFSAFIEESTKIVQRALSDGYDYIRDYTIGIDSAL